MQATKAKYIQLGLAVAFVAISLYPFAFRKIFSSDLWWHLEAGQIIRTTGEIPKTDPFSFTAEGEKWVTHEWLFEVFASWLDDTFGIDSLVILRFILVYILIGLLFYQIWRRSGSPIFAAIFSYLLIFVINTRIELRPHLITFILLVILTFILEQVRAGKIKRLLLLPPIFLFWANVHAGVDFGLVLIAFYALAETVRLIRPSTREATFKRMTVPLLSASVAVCFAIGLINPNGLEALLYPITLLMLDPLVYANIIEYQPLTALPLDSFVAFLAVAGFGLIVGFRRIRIEHILILPFFLLLSLKSVRNVPVLAVIGAGLIAETYAPLSTALAEKMSRDIKMKTVVVALALLTCYFSWRVYLALDMEGRTGFGIDEKLLPLDGVKFLNKMDASGKVFNVHRHGGILVYYFYPDMKIFIDGRNEVYKNVKTFELYVLLMRHDRPGDILDALGVDWITAIPIADGLRFGQKIFDDPKWAFVYSDDGMIIFVRRGLLAPEVETELEYRYYFPEYNHTKQMLAVPDRRQKLLAEIRRAREARQNASALFCNGLYYESVGRVLDSENSIMKAYHQNRSIAGINYYYALHFHDKNMDEQALDFVNRELATDSGNRDAQKLLWQIDGGSP